MDPDGTALLSVLREPRHSLSLGVTDWNMVLECGKRHALLGRLCVLLEEAGLSPDLPQTVREVLTDARLTAEANQTFQRYEASRTLHAMRELDLPLVLLKGGAYLMAGLPPARGRLSGDLDIMVPRTRIEEVEQAVLAEGWKSAVTDAYDQMYYREWSHQIPPLRHEERESELDIHHTIAPPTGPANPDAEAILADAQPIADGLFSDGRLRVLCPADMVLHSAVHLFNEQMTMALRDLNDMHDLVAHFGADEAFWPELLRRAVRHGVERPLFYCSRYCRKYLGTRIPAEAEAQVAAFGPNMAVRTIMDWLVEAALIHAPPNRAAPRAAFARWLLLVRSHWLRMPLGMLVRHMVVKATRRVQGERPAETIPQA